MSQTIKIRKGLIAIGRAAGQNLVAMAVFQIIIDRILAGNGDALDASALAENLGCSREDVIGALDHLCAKGLLGEPDAAAKGWSDVNAISPVTLTIHVEATRGLQLFTNIGEEEAGSPAPGSPQAATTPTIERTVAGKHYRLGIEQETQNGAVHYYFAITEDGALVRNGTADTEEECIEEFEKFLPIDKETEPAPAAKPRRSRK